MAKTLTRNAKGELVFTAQEVFKAMTHQPISDFIEKDLDEYLCGEPDAPVEKVLVEKLEYLLMWGIRN